MREKKRGEEGCVRVLLVCGGAVPRQQGGRHPLGVRERVSDRGGESGGFGARFAKILQDLVSLWLCL